MVITGKPPCCELRLLPFTRKDTFPKVIGAAVMPVASRFNLYELTTSLAPSLLVCMAEPRYSKLPIVIDFVREVFEVCATARESISGANRRTAQTILVDMNPHRSGDSGGELKSIRKTSFVSMPGIYVFTVSGPASGL